MSSISGISGGYSGMMMQGMGGMKRPDPSQMANDLFSKLDSSGQGYIEKADLQNAFDQAGSKVPAAGGASASADELFSQLDTDGDGKVTKEEFSDSVNRLADEMERQFRLGRAQGSMPSGPPPGGVGDAGMTKDELASAAEQAGETDSTLAGMLGDLVENFDAADINQDGKVTMQETMTYHRSQRSAAPDDAAGGASDNNDAKVTGDDNFEGRLLLQIMKLAQAYGFGQAEDSAPASLLGTA